MGCGIGSDVSRKTNSKKPQPTEVHLSARIPTELRDRLQRAAEANHRTVTGELIARLLASFNGGQS